jgi:phosphatidylglycerol:prolipoprotein diacylglycerol transferase
MHPIAFHIAGYPIRYAGLLYLVAIVIAWVYTWRVARRRQWDTEVVLPGMAVVVAAAYLGARLHGAMHDWNGLAPGSLREVLGDGDLSLFGGLLLGAVAMVAFLRWARLPVGVAADEMSAVAPVLYAIFRLGCFLNGDDYGLPTSLPWGMSFPDGAPPTHERVHPVQLYEMALMVPIWMAVRWRTRFGLPDGARTFELCMPMGMERFFIEFLRPQAEGTSYLGTPQWLALALVAVGIVGRLRLRRSENATE